MINDFEDFCTWMYLIVDDIFEQIDTTFQATWAKTGLQR